MIEIVPKFLLDLTMWINNTKSPFDHITFTISKTLFSSKTSNGNMFVCVNAIKDTVLLVHPDIIQETLNINEDDAMYLSMYYVLYGFSYFYKDGITISKSERIQRVTEWLNEYNKVDDDLLYNYFKDWRNQK